MFKDYNFIVNRNFVSVFLYHAQINPTNKLFQKIWSV